MTVIWKSVVGYEGLYSVSNDGRVRSERARRVMHASKAGIKRDYEHVTLKVNGKARNAYVHHLVAEAFLGTPPGSVGRGTDDWQCNHKNGNKSDNRPENLEWLTHEKHIVHTKESGLFAVGEAAACAKLNSMIVRIIRRCGELGISHKDIGALWNVGRRAVDRIITRERWAHV